MAKKKDNKENSENKSLLLIVGLAVVLLIIFVMVNRSTGVSNMKSQPPITADKETVVTGNIDTDLKSIDTKMDSLNLEDFDVTEIDRMQQ